MNTVAAAKMTQVVHCTPVTITDERAVAFYTVSKQLPGFERWWALVDETFDNAGTMVPLPKLFPSMFLELGLGTNLAKFVIQGANIMRKRALLSDEGIGAPEYFDEGARNGARPYMSIMQQHIKAAVDPESWTHWVRMRELAVSFYDEEGCVYNSSEYIQTSSVLSSDDWPRYEGTLIRKYHDARPPLVMPKRVFPARKGRRGVSVESESQVEEELEVASGSSSASTVAVEKKLAVVDKGKRREDPLLYDNQAFVCQQMVDAKWKELVIFQIGKLVEAGQPLIHHGVCLVWHDKAKRYVIQQSDNWHFAKHAVDETASVPMDPTVDISSLNLAKLDLSNLPLGINHLKLMEALQEALQEKTASYEELEETAAFDRKQAQYSKSGKSSWKHKAEVFTYASLQAVGFRPPKRKAEEAGLDLVDDTVTPYLVDVQDPIVPDADVTHEMKVEETQAPSAVVESANKRKKKKVRKSILQDVHGEKSVTLGAHGEIHARWD